MAKMSATDRRKNRVRRAVKARAGARPRLSVFRSCKNIYAQIIDDTKGVTLAAASTLENELKGVNGANVAAAGKVGEMVADRAIKAGISEVVFDRGSYVYHGRVKALAEGAREGGLSF